MFLRSVCFIGLLLLSGIDSVQAEEFSVIGVLPAALEPDNAKALELSEAQVTQLKDLVKQKQREAVGFSQQLRSLEPAERRMKEEEFASACERAGMALLNVDQRGKLEKIRIARKGLVTLAEPQVAEAVSLSAEQRTKVGELVGQLHAARPEERSEVGSRVERELRQVLADEQWASWQTMAGLAAATSPAAATSTSSPVDSSVAKATETAKPILEGESAKSAEGTAPSSTQPSGDGLVLNFRSAPWDQVLPWLADQAGLSLQVDTMPPGTFSYRDMDKTYSTAETIDVINGVLLNKGYTLIRRKRMLMLLDLEQELSTDVLRELAELVTVEELDRRGEYEPLKCLFVVSRMSPEDAEKEIKKLIGPQGSAIAMTSAGQILVTETAGKLRTIREMLQRVEDPETARGSKIVSIPLKNISAEEVLLVARPLLGLKEGENSSEQFSVSTDTFGTTIFATGTPDRIQKLKDLADQLESAQASGPAATVSAEQPFVKSHRILGSDSETCYQVLQSLLAGLPDVMMSLDPKSNQIIVQGRKADHDLVDKTLKELAGQNEDFEVIQLTKLDPETAILAINKFFGGSSNGKEKAEGAPIVDGDSLARTLWVKGSRTQIEQIKDLVARLQETSGQDDLLGEKVRMLNLSGRSADKALEQIEVLWKATQNRNRIRVISPKDRQSAGGLPQRRATKKEEIKEKETNRASTPKKEPTPDVDASTASAHDVRLVSFNGQPPAEQPPAVEASPSDAAQDANASDAPANSEDESSTEDAELGAAQALKDAMGDSAEDIVVMRGPSGLIITSQDPKALAQFERMLRLLVDQSAVGNGEPTVYYLQYIKAQAAAELLDGILKGESARGGGGGGLLGNMASNVLGEMGGGLMGGLLGLGGGGGGSSSSSSSSKAMATGDVSIVADPRLNALIVQANGTDLQLIEQLLEVIDQEDSPLDVSTRGKTELIPVLYSDANDVAEIVKQMFADRISQAGANGGGGAQRQPTPQEFIQALRGGGGGNGRGGNGQSEVKEATMAIGVDRRSNSLVVTASQGLIDEVKNVVALIDQAGQDTEESVQVVQVGGNVNPTVVKNALTSILGPQAKTNTTSSTNNNTQNQQAPAGMPGGFQPGGFNPGAMGRGFAFPGGGFPGGFQGFGGQVGQGAGRGGNAQGGNRGGGFFPGGGGFGFPGGFGGQGAGGNRGAGNRGGGNRGGN